MDLDHRLEYEWLGPPPEETPTIVMLHHGLGSLSAWKEFPTGIAEETGLGVLVYSRLGYGQSDSVATEARTVDFMHREARGDLPRILRTLGVSRPILLGQSDGASISIIYAGSPTGPTPLGLVLLAPHVFVEDCTVSSAVAAAEEYEHGELGEKMARHHADPDGAFYGWFETWRAAAFRDWNIEEFLGAVVCPTRLIQGMDDEYGTVAQLEAIQRQATGPVSRVMLDDCGHSPHRDHPERTLLEIRQFVSSLL